MKNFKLAFTFSMLLMFAFTNNINAFTPTTTTNPVETETIEESEKEVKFFAKVKKKTKRFAEKIANTKLKFAEIEFDLKDPVDKWMWYWLGGWIIGAAIYIIAAILAVASAGVFASILSLLGFLVTLFGTVSLVLWLVKKFG